MAATLLALLAAATIAPTRDANGTTLPFQRHVVRIRGVLAAAVQLQGDLGEGLALYTSRDDGASWRLDQDIQRDARIRDTADLVVDAAGSGFWLVYGVEPRQSQFGPYPGSDVVFLHYQLLPGGRFGADLGPVVLYRPSAGQGYFRPSLAIDTAGVMHVAATWFDGSHYRWLIKSSTNGINWSAPTPLADFGGVAGAGRIIAVGNRVAVLYDDYRVNTPGRFRVKPAGAAPNWGPEVAFAPDGLYHAGAFSVCATGDGALHLGYSDKPFERLHYRRWDGTRWSAPVLLEANGIWSNQIGTSATASGVVLVWNHKDAANRMRMMTVTRSWSGSFSPVRVLDDVAGFKGYTNAIEHVDAGTHDVALWSWQAQETVGTALIKALAF